MNSRERFHATMRYRPVDRPWSWEMGPYAATVDRWLKEGLRSRAIWRTQAGTTAWNTPG